MKLEEYEEICPDCDGKGCIEIKGSLGGIRTSCIKCKTRGKIDWIDRIKKCKRNLKSMKNYVHIVKAVDGLIIIGLMVI